MLPCAIRRRIERADEADGELQSAGRRGLGRQANRAEADVAAMD